KRLGPADLRLAGLARVGQPGRRVDAQRLERRARALALGLLLRLLVAVLELVEQRLAHRVGAPAELQVAAVAERHGARLDGLPAGGDVEVEVELRQLARAKTRERARELERDRAGECREPLRLE